MSKLVKRRAVIAFLGGVFCILAASGQNPASSAAGDETETQGQASVSTPGNELRPRLSFEFAGKSRAYYAFIPEIEGPLPVVVLLHGSGRSGQVMIDAWKGLAAKERFIVVAPDAWDPAGWGVKMDSPEFLHAVVGQIEAKHAIDACRVYLFGHSAGAVYALILSVIDSRFFSAAAIHAGALPPGYESQILARADRRTPIAIWVGDKDPLFHADAVTATRSLLEANGFPVKLTVISNHDHNYYAIADEINKQAWSFLKRARLKP